MEEKEKEKKSNLVEWIQMTGWHGILDCYVATHRIWMIFWILVVLTGVFMAIVQSYYMFTGYLFEDQIVTSINYEAPPEGRLPWPNISIRPVYSIRWDDRSLANKGTKSPQQEETTAQSNDQVETTETTMFLEPLDYTTESSVPEETLEQKQAVLCHEIGLQCGTTYGYQLYNLRSPDECCTNLTGSSYEYYSLIPDATFSGKKKKYGEGSRIFYAFSNINAKIGYEVKLYYGNLESDDRFSAIFYISPGTQNVISMTYESYRVKQMKRAINFGILDLPCGKNPAEYKYYSESTYSKDSCARDCSVQWQMKFCNCTEYNTSRRSRKCSNDEEWVCAVIGYYATSMKLHNLPLDEELNKEITDEMIESAKCADECPDPCEYDRVEAQISSLILLNEVDIMDDLFSNPDPNFKKQAVMLEMYYSSNQKRVYETAQKLTIDEFMSNIGGLLGVWSGISFLSIVQILYYIVKGCLQCVGDQMRKPKRVHAKKEQHPYYEDMKIAGVHEPPSINVS